MDRLEPGELPSREDGPEELEMDVGDIEAGPADAEGFVPLRMRTSRGDIALRYYRVPQVNDARRGVIWVGGAGGGFASPARDLYPRMAIALTTEGIASLHVSYRQPRSLDESVLDVLAGLGYLQGEGIEELCLVGHSMGGAVVIQAGTASGGVRGVATLATQSYGADLAAELPEGCGLLAVHGADDDILPPRCSEAVYRVAHEPKRLRIFEGAGHSLDEVADEVEHALRGWLRERLG